VRFPITIKHRQNQPPKRLTVTVLEDDRPAAMTVLSEILGYHDGENLNCGLLGYNAL
jgi:hypothetical protein